MNDRELLEMVAKAAGMNHLVWNNGKTNAYYAGSLFYMTAPGSHTPWNPLTSDGDALRLAVKLKMLVSFENGKACALPAGQSSDDFFEAREKLKPEPYAATRRAIVRAAAEIGKAMQPGVLK